MEQDDQLGRGSFGTVYGAVHEETGQRAAVKILAESADFSFSDLRARLERELVISAAVRHEHLAGVLDGGHDNGVLWAAMERIEGDTLARQVPVAEEDTFVTVVVQLAGALEALHNAGAGSGRVEHAIVHRDVKPANVMLIGRGLGARSVLIDLGSVKILDGSETRGIGTMEWVAPSRLGFLDASERRGGDRALSEADDV